MTIIFFIDQSVRSMSTSAAEMPAARKTGIELRQLLAEDELDIATYRTALFGPVYLYSLGQKLHQGSRTDPPYRDRIHGMPSQRLQRLTHPMFVVGIVVIDFLYALCFGIDNNKTRGRSKMFKDQAIHCIQIFSRKSYLHFYISLLPNFQKQWGKISSLMLTVSINKVDSRKTLMGTDSIHSGQQKTLDSGFRRNDGRARSSDTNIADLVGNSTTIPLARPAVLIQACPAVLIQARPAVLIQARPAHLTQNS
jgi:hypothetical protein